MDLILQANLEHQTTPVMSVADLMDRTPKMAPRQPHQNPTIIDHLNITELQQVQARNIIDRHLTPLAMNPETFRTKVKGLPEFQMIDVKMETGTGKTYVYTRTMYELHERFGYNKFIVAVPSLAIKAGAANFLSDSYVMHHFKDACCYGAEIELCLVEPQKKKKKGRQNFPPAVGRFFYGTKRDSKKIYVLLLNTQLLTGSSKLLTRDDYDQMVGDFHIPVDAISDCRPVLIIDEPHRMKRDTDTFKNLISRLHPQLVIRYGATFPKVMVDIVKDKKKKKESVPDYVNLIYDLNACKAFNEVLIKGIAKETPKLPGAAKEEKRVTVVSIDSKAQTAKLKIETESGNREVTVSDSGFDLCQLDEDLRGITFEGIDNGMVCLSNGVELHERDVVFADLYSTSYQEEMIKLALYRHFQAERENFHRTPTRIKTLALFFIDNIESFRGIDDESGHHEGWLKKRFKVLLTEQVKMELQKGGSADYQAFLQATLDHLDDTCAGYFSRDNQDTEERVEEEVRLILHGKKELLSFSKIDGKPNVCRFLFSKWTLKEGWDNPNVFTICKLRSSGSEISKLQEVGRGLRLPVDEVGNRIQDSSFMLNYIVDFTEKQFASQLVAEINGYKSSEENDIEITLTDELMQKIADARQIDANTLFFELVTGRYIDMNRKVLTNRIEDFLLNYPEVNNLSRGRVKDRNVEQKPAKIRKVQFQMLEDLWRKLNHKYILYFDQDIDNQLRTDLPSRIKEDRVFGVQVVSSERTFIEVTENGAEAVKDFAYKFNSSSRFIHYGEFLKRVSQKTDIPINLLHESIANAVKLGVKIEDNMFNEGSKVRFISCINDWKCEKLKGLVRYKKTQYEPKETKLTNADGTLRDDVAVGDIGVNYCPDKPLDKYLYDAIYYDSDIELNNIREDIESVVVYGKIPKKSICIPTVASSNYTPDFMYRVQRKDGQEALFIVLESKGYDSSSGLSEEEKSKVACAKRLYEKMSEEGIDVKFEKQLNTQQVMDIINHLID